MNPKLILKNTADLFWTTTQKWYFWLVLYILMISLLTYQAVGPRFNLSPGKVLGFIVLFPVFPLFLFLKKPEFGLLGLWPFFILVDLIYYIFVIYSIKKMAKSKIINKKLILILFLILVIPFVTSLIYIFRFLS